ncbi:uncharacterized protein LOC132725161 [Ruditapes philippinarum]|uniref:uncharacterized protein LOC132725161 n=1 Tax=Ruditapes philippinarum TaxID=129788 RepID=UPI00295B8F86|nr:uncharacterized protein LOC132725161 [Ruditapes philippinarum]
MGKRYSKLVLAIEVGNYKSGFAFGEGDRKNSKIYTAIDDTNRQIGRIPTALLLKEDLSLDNFGFYAEEKYISLSLKNEHSNYRFVNNIDICQSDDKLCIKDCRGNELEAVHIYLTIINYLLQMCLKQTKRYEKFENLEKSLIVTLPDFVSKELKDSLKRLIKDVKTVRFVSTSEAAAAYCISQQLILDGETNTKKMQNGTSFIVVNFGRRLTSVCLHRMISDDDYKLLQEFKIGTGGDSITDIFFEDIIKKYGIGHFWNILGDHFCGYMDLRRGFDNEKHKFNNSTECVLIEMPTSIIMKQNDNHSDKSIVFKDNKVIISQKLMKDYFQRSLSSLISTIQEIVKGRENIKCVLLLGGYSKSPIVREIIEEVVRPKQSILVYEPDKGVLNGAVMLGFQGNREVEEIYGIICLRKQMKRFSSIKIEYEGHKAYFLQMVRSSELKDRKSITCELEFEEDEKNQPIVLYRIDSAKIATKQPLTEKDFEKVTPAMQPRNCILNDKEKAEISMTENGVIFSLEMQIQPNVKGSENKFIG